MMTITRYPSPQEWAPLLERSASSFEALMPAVEEIILTVQAKGDAALREYTHRFDGVELNHIELQPEEIDTAGMPDNELKQAIDTAIENITRFHQPQVMRPATVETMPGVTCWRKPVAIEKVGLYIPGGTAPLFSTLLMLAIPAKIAGCKEIILCTPPSKSGGIHPAIIYAARQTGVTRIFKVGGAQAIAAMAYGTATVPAVYKILGPGNRYVTAAKMWLSARGMAIDMPAGPSELAVLADDSCVPAWVAADLLSQAEHGADSQVVLVSDSETVLTAVLTALEQQLTLLPRKTMATAALHNSRFILVSSIEEGMALVNAYAPEHLIIACAHAAQLAEAVINAGSVFIGNYAPESAGDYASGTNHTLPTSGFARAYSGVSVDSFVKKITFQQITAQGIGNIGPAVMRMAEAEGLHAHANAVAIRLRDAKKDSMT